MVTSASHIHRMYQFYHRQADLERDEYTDYEGSMGDDDYYTERNWSAESGRSP